MTIKFFMKCLLLLLVTACTRGVSYIPPAICQYDEWNRLSQIERDVLNEINTARTQPQLYAEFIENESVKIEPGSNEGMDAVDEAIDFLKSTKPLKPLKFSSCLYLAAKDHVNNQGSAGKLGHSGSDGSSPSDRANRYAIGKVYCGENISYGKNSAREIVIQLIVDDGVPSRGHRDNIFNKDYKRIGTAVGRHAVYNSMCVISFSLNEIEEPETKDDSQI